LPVLFGLMGSGFVTELLNVKYKIIPVTPFEQNCSLIWCEETQQAAVIDPGGDLPIIEAAISELNLELVSILVTHAHLDHVGAVAEMAENRGVDVIGPHIEDQFWIDALGKQAAMFNFPPSQPFVPKRWLQQGDQVLVGNVVLDVLHCPGHTPGHVIFYSAKDQRAFVGDVLFAGSIGRTDFPRGNHADLLKSINEKLLPLGDDIEFVPGHGPMSTFGAERLNNTHL